MPSLPNANNRLDECMRRALNRIKKSSTAEEITELLNRDLGPGIGLFRQEKLPHGCGMLATQSCTCIGSVVAPADSRHPRRITLEFRGFSTRKTINTPADRSICQNSADFASWRSQPVH